MRMNRRTLIRLAGGAAMALAPQAVATPSAEQAPPPAGPFVLPPLPYAAGALEPHIDAQTMTIHHDRHHQAYVTNLNAALAGNAAIAGVPLDDLLRRLDTLPEAVRTAVRNNGGGHANHLQFWTLLSPKGGGAPTGATADALRSTFGSFETFKEQVNKAGVGRFGSGWAWLVEANGTLAIESTANQDNPMMEGKRAILGVDVWEHAYYLKYQNRRPDYLAAWWNVIDWDAVNKRLG